MNNVFAIQKPETIDCQVNEYHWGRSMMTLKLSRQGSPEIQYIKFAGVEVFSGPMIWTGANFILRPTTECLELLVVAGRANDFVTEKDLVERNIRLYAVELAQLHVQIICHTANKYSG
jgi:hypothetical protein